MEEAFKYLCQKDQILKQIIEDYGFPDIQKREEGFASMCHIILEQQVSIASAKATYTKLNNYFQEITPKKIATASNEALKNCGLSRQKSMYIKDLAEKVLSKQLDFSSFLTKTEAQIRSELVTIKGVGNWSIEVYLMFCLQKPNIIPLGDIAIKNTMKLLYNTQTLDEMLDVSNSWKPYRTAASYIIWHQYLSIRKVK